MIKLKNLLLSYSFAIIFVFSPFFSGCEDNNSPDNNSLQEDCLGIAGGFASLDSCGVCDDNPDNDCVEDCAGVWGGNSSIDYCGDCDDNPDNDCALISFSPENQNISINESISLDLELQGLSDSIFAVSMEINYNDSILIFNDSTGFNIGEFFGDEIIYLIYENNTSIYFSISIQQGNTMVDGSGSIVSFEFFGLSPGTSVIEILPSNLKFFDSTGNEIIISNLESTTSIITVTS